MPEGARHGWVILRCPSLPPSLPHSLSFSLSLSLPLSLSLSLSLSLFHHTSFVLQRYIISFMPYCRDISVEESPWKIGGLQASDDESLPSYSRWGLSVSDPTEVLVNNEKAQVPLTPPVELSARTQRAAHRASKEFYNENREPTFDQEAARTFRVIKISKLFRHRVTRFLGGIRRREKVFLH